MSFFTDLPIKDSWVYTPKIHHDERGHFFESYQKEKFIKKIPNTTFVQDNQVQSKYGVLRGLHYQTQSAAQAKLVRVIQGKILDVAVDIRSYSPTFGQHVKVELSAENQKQFFVPHGFAHGYVSLSNHTIVMYKCDQFYSPDHEAGIRFDDPALNIDWGLDPSLIILSKKDKILPLFADHKPFDEH